MGVRPSSQIHRVRFRLKSDHQAGGTECMPYFFVELSDHRISLKDGLSLKVKLLFVRNL